MKKRGILEVLLVNADGIRHTRILGTPSYHVSIQCGSQVHKSKLSPGKGGKTWWNEKFRFEFPLSDWKRLTHLKFRIMDTKFFSDGGFVGETIIHLERIITEGIHRGTLEMKPAPYNVVIEDDIYRGEIKIGLKFITTTRGAHSKTRAFLAGENGPSTSLYKSIISLWKFSWWNFWRYCKPKRN